VLVFSTCTAWNATALKWINTIPPCISIESQESLAQQSIRWQSASGPVLIAIWNGILQALFTPYQYEGQTAQQSQKDAFVFVDSHTSLIHVDTMRYTFIDQINWYISVVARSVAFEFARLSNSPQEVFRMLVHAIMNRTLH